VPVLTREEAEEIHVDPGEFDIGADTRTPPLLQVPAVILRALASLEFCLRPPARRQTHPLTLHAVDRSRAKQAICKLTHIRVIDCTTSCPSQRVD
jgi:hypothetical protein